MLFGGGGLSPIFFLLLFYLIVVYFHDDNTPMQYTAIQKFIALKNQRTNGPVNANLIYGPTASTKTNKIGKSQPRIIIYINFVKLESQMLHAKFQDHWTSGSREDFKGFYHIWAWRPSWSCDLYHLHELSFPLPKEVSHEIWH